MKQNLTLPTPSISTPVGGDTDSPTRQLRSMSVAVTAVPSPLVVNPASTRPRTNSLPNPAFLLGFSGCRDPRTCCVSVRSFTTTAKGVINAGDIVRKTSVNSLMSSGSARQQDQRRQSSGQALLAEAQCYEKDTGGAASGLDRQRTLSLASTDSSSSSGSSPYVTNTSTGRKSGVANPSYFRVAIQGDEGVGKTALTRQFSSSEYMGTYDNMTSSDGEMTSTTIVHVLLDGEESIMEFIDGANAYQMDDINVDAYIVVFSIVDRNSFLVAKDLARQLRVNLGTDRAIILVANKTDLVRKRQVSVDEARLIASAFDCKYIETSAALNHQIDELVAGTLGQIRHQLLPPGSALMPPPPTKSRSRTPSPVSFFNKLFRRNAKGSASCEGIFMK
ncbi:GTP-binding protein REM 1 [Biomphalaria pfeifferi]|uniref:GTP-binding protein REM 1 n=1 Tax=Biomphalaria pfeifferi TaxID=112525 RepID=A0AAD8B9C9_BIOPF|nr:GTP-binding protein REM 1 [Biomphalaria pfeifferi]